MVDIVGSRYLQYLSLRRDELITIWEETRDRYPEHKCDIDVMFARQVNEIQMAIDSWANLVVHGDYTSDAEGAIMKPS